VQLHAVHDLRVQDSCDCRSRRVTRCYAFMRRQLRAAASPSQL
jgi:hypothetical protein